MQNVEQKHTVYESLYLKSSANHDFLYKIHTEASLVSSDVSNSLNENKVLLGLVSGKVIFETKTSTTSQLVPSANSKLRAALVKKLRKLTKHF